MLTEEKLLNKITDFYVNSRDFNGLPARPDLLPEVESDYEGFMQCLRSLIKQEKVSFCVGGNPHIKAFQEPSGEKQLEILADYDVRDGCLYPNTSHLKTIVDQNEWRDRPFTQRLKLGEPQLGFHSFDLSVLETYRNDPRYHYKCNDVSGYICVKSSAEAEKMREADQILLETFGFSYNDNMDRAVAVFTRYLHDLSSQHQQIWYAKMLPDDAKYKLHPDYFRSSYLGEFFERESVFDALLSEQHHINKMSELMGRPHLFRKEYEHEEKPAGFGFLIRPTKKEFHDFVMLLDKIISENINMDFFMGEIEPLQEEIRDGKTIMTSKGSIQILREWFQQTIRVREDGRQAIEKMIATFREIRKLRQRPAHAVDDNHFDQKYFKEQRALMQDAYIAIRDIRLFFANHPAVKGYELPRYLKEGMIWLQ